MIAKVVYPDSFKADVMALFPNNKTVHRALRENCASLGSILENESIFTVDAVTLLSHQSNGTVAALFSRAKEVLEIDRLRKEFLTLSEEKFH